MIVKQCQAEKLGRHATSHSWMTKELNTTSAQNKMRANIGVPPERALAGIFVGLDIVPQAVRLKKVNNK